MANMTKGQTTRLAILNELNETTFISGQVLATKFGVSRATISKHILALTELGIDIFSVTGKGYKLAKRLNLINTNAFDLSLEQLNLIEVLPIIDSTNSYIMRLLREGQQISDGHTVIAECQTEGKGRRGRQWISPFGSHIYLSRYFQSTEGLAATGGLSIAIGIAIKNAVNRFINVKAQLKWPNDILIDNKKLGGVLVEAEGQSDGLCHLVIGIGLNVSMPTLVTTEIDQPWTDMSKNSGAYIDRNKVCIALMEELDTVLMEFKENGLRNLYKEWNADNAFKGQVVNLISGKQSKRVRCMGIDQNGALMIEDLDTLLVKKIHGGEISLRNVI
jgi:BirA family transcriptional regulator, biotin operon repressor / biotin---[acetyl-CoA-carboxylase] ligase